jgi:hypothetical protein
MQEFDMKKFSRMLVSSLILFGVTQAQNFDPLGAFQTPSGNIFCDAYRDGKTSTLRCDLVTNNAKVPAKPKDCDLDWGNSFVISERGTAQRNCHGDTNINPNNKRLEYGQKWRAAGFTCDANTKRLRCINLDGHGFELAKSAQRFF